MNLQPELIGVAAVDQSDLLTSLNRLLEWLESQNATRQAQIIEYLVAEEVAGRGDHIKAYSIALDVFHKDADFDPTQNSLVRVEMHRLRLSLQRFREEHTSTAPYDIVLIPGSYRPHLTLVAHRNAPSRPAAPLGDIAPPDAELPDAVPIIPDTGDLAEDPAESDASPSLSRSMIPVIAAVIIAIVALALAGPFVARHLGWGNPPHIAQMSPSVSVTFDPQSMDAQTLGSLAQGIVGLNPGRYPANVINGGAAEYQLNLSTITAPGNTVRLQAALTDRSGATIHTRTFALNNPASPENLEELQYEIDRLFLKDGGFLSNSFAADRRIPPVRRAIYGCYRTVRDYTMGRYTGVPDGGRLLTCLDPREVAAPEDKVLLHLIRARLLADTAFSSGLPPYRQSIPHAMQEIQAAREIYPDEIRLISTEIAVQWRNPQRNSPRFRELLERAQRSGMNADIRYDVAASYAYFLGDWDMARKVITTELSGEDQALTIGPIYHFVPVPEFFVKGQYSQALDELKKTEASKSAAYAIFYLAIGCASGNHANIEQGRHLVTDNPALSLFELDQAVVERRYAPVLEDALLSALSSPACTNREP